MRRTNTCRRFAERFARFADLVGDRLSRERRDLFERLLDAAPRLLARYHSHRNVTIVQGDAHVWNSFLPREGGGDDVRLFDWDLWRIDVASDDLAYMMAMHWYPDLRRRMERPLLDRYHAALVAHGVRGYDRRALDDDYRLSVLWQITTPGMAGDKRHPAGDLVEQPRAHPVGRRRSRLPRSARLTTSDARLAWSRFPEHGPWTCPRGSASIGSTPRWSSWRTMEPGQARPRPF